MFFDVGIIVSCLDGRARTSLCPKHHLAEHDRAIHGVVVTGQVDCYVWGREVVPGWGSWLEARNVYNLFLLWLFLFTVYIHTYIYIYINIYSCLFCLIYFLPFSWGPAIYLSWCPWRSGHKSPTWIERGCTFHILKPSPFVIHKNLWYPLVNVYITMENHHILWVNQL